MRVTPLETYRAVNITGSAAKDVVTEMVSDSVQRARNAVEDARAVAERSRAKAELMEDRPCPDVSRFSCSLWSDQHASPASCLLLQIRSHCFVTFTSNVCVRQLKCL